MGFARTPFQGELDEAYRTTGTVESERYEAAWVAAQVFEPVDDRGGAGKDRQLSVLSRHDGGHSASGFVL